MRGVCGLVCISGLMPPFMLFDARQHKQYKVSDDGSNSPSALQGLKRILGRNIKVGCMDVVRIHEKGTEHLERVSGLHNLDNNFAADW